MQIVIDIPRKVYDALKHMDFDANLVVDEMRNSIANGTPLPKKQGLIDKLLETEKNLSIGKDINGNITVRFEYGYIKDDGVLIGSFGKGETFEEAVIDYCRQISGKTLVFDYPNSKRETFKILILGEGIWQIKRI